MNRKPDAPTLTREDRENLRAMRRMNRQAAEDERFKQEIDRLLQDLQTRLAQRTQRESKS